MAEKLSWTELRRTLAARAGATEKEANAFLAAFSTQLVEALKRDKQVKINGLGIFRLQAVAPRKSINVTTGEEITIEGYNKIAFAPEAGVKELIESHQPSAVRNQPAEIDPLKKLGAQAAEIVDILSDLGQSPVVKSEEPKEPEVPETPEVEKPFIPGSDELVSPAPEKQKQKHHFVRDVLICVVILLLILFGAYFFCRSQLSNWLDDKLQQQPTLVQDTVRQEPVVKSEEVRVKSEEPVVEEPAPEDPVVEEPVLEEPVLEDPPTIKEPAEDFRPAKGQELTYAGWIIVEPMHQDSRLAWMAKRYYGAKIYWPYLFDTNRDRFKNPNRIPTGTAIRVPKLTAAQKDTTNAQTLATLERLRLQAETRMR